MNLKIKEKIAIWISRYFIPEYLKHWILITVLNDIQNQGGAFQALMIDVIEKHSEINHIH